MNIGAEGHVCYLALVPNIVERRETVIERYPDNYDDPELRMRPRVVGYEDILDADEPRKPTGETVCEWGRIASVQGDLVTVSGFSSSGRPFTWRGVQVAPEPAPVTEPGREDPAGHAFHAIADCLWGR